MGRVLRFAAAVVLSAALLVAACDGEDDNTDDASFAWVDVPGGSFVMGCVDGDGYCLDDESPAHDVTIDGFQMLATEVTLLQYLSVTGENPSYFSDCSRCPVESVTVSRAEEFCALIGARLPTEAEWEYAARAGTRTVFICGDDVACLSDVAWDSADAGGRTHPAGTLAPNGWGLYDLAGNVWEWTADTYAPDYYAGSPADNPTGPGGDGARVVRGGSWYVGNIFQMRLSYRGYAAGLRPNQAEFQIGFRCVR